MTISVLIPSWRRTASLMRTLDAIIKQTRPVEELVVVLKAGDETSAEAVAKWAAATGRLIKVITAPSAANLVAQMNLGLNRTTGDLVALTDDDAEPHSDWTTRFHEAFTESSVGGVGGRDWQEHDLRNVQKVGIVSWYGRAIGNHHIGAGAARDVDLLKGVNCCFRGPLLRDIGFDTRLRGDGNVSHWEMALCLELSRRGFRLRYDPAIGVNHYPEPRMDGDTNARGGFESTSFVNNVHNEVLVTLRRLNIIGRVTYHAWLFSIGTSGTPGLVQVMRLAAGRQMGISEAWAKWRAVRRGTAEALQTWRKS